MSNQKNLNGDVKGESGVIECDGNTQIDVQKENIKNEADINMENNNFKIWPQAFAAFFIAMSQMNSGGQLGYSAVALPVLIDPESDDLVLNTAQVSIFTSISSIGGLVAALSSGVWMTWFGQRRMMAMGLVVAIIGWIMGGVAPSFGVLAASRLILGISTGLIDPATHNYIVELSHPSIRGRLAGFYDIFRQLGLVITAAIGSLNITWRHLAFIEIAFMIPPFLVLLLIPDSPRWLASKGRDKDTHKSLTFFRGKKYDVKKEQEEIQQQLKSSTAALSVTNQLSLVFTKDILPIFLVTSILVFILPFSGNPAVASYSVVIFQSANGSINAYTSSFVISVFRFAGVITNFLIVDKLNRKTLVCWPLILIAIACCILGVYLYLQKEVNPSIDWIPLACLIVYSFFANILGPILLLMRSELLPTPIRSLATGFQFALISVGTFLVVFCYPYFEQYLGLHWTFAVYAVCSVVMIVMTVFLIPETKGKTLEQIGKAQSKKNQNKSDDEEN